MPHPLWVLTLLAWQNETLFFTSLDKTRFFFSWAHTICPTPGVMFYFFGERQTRHIYILFDLLMPQKCCIWESNWLRGQGLSALNMKNFHRQTFFKATINQSTYCGYFEQIKLQIAKNNKEIVVFSWQYYCRSISTYGESCQVIKNQQFISL